MDRAEKRALEAFPIPSAISEKEKENILKCGRRRIYANGYRRAEQDLALTWEDMNLIDSILIDMQDEGVERYGGLRQYYEEALKRFNEQRKK